MGKGGVIVTFGMIVKVHHFLFNPPVALLDKGHDGISPADVTDCPDGLISCRQELLRAAEHRLLMAVPDNVSNRLMPGHLAHPGLGLADRRQRDLLALVPALFNLAGTSRGQVMGRQAADRRTAAEGDGQDQAPEAAQGPGGQATPHARQNSLFTSTEFCRW